MIGTLWIGIDPGKTGGIVALDDSGRHFRHTLMPLIGERTKRCRPSLNLLLEWYEREVRGDEERRVVVAIERVSSAPNDGPVQAFSFGRALQVCWDFADVLGATAVEISPKDWQKIWLRGYRKGSRNDIKASAALVAAQRYPELAKPLQRKNRWGLADAALIAATAKLMELDFPH